MATNIDRLFALKALEQKIVEERKMLEYECRDELLEAYAIDGTDRRTSPYFGNDAGKFSVKRYKAKPGKEVVEYNVTDEDAFAEWQAENADAAHLYVGVYAAEFSRWWFEQNGELPDGIARVTYETDGEPERLSAQVYSFKPDIVLEKLSEGGNVFEGANRLLLGDGNAG